MSFILDALRRAESQRGHQPQPVTADNALDGIAEPEATPLVSPRTALGLLGGVALIALATVVLLRDPQPAVPLTDTRSVAVPPPVYSGVGADTPLAEVAVPAQREVRPLDEVARRASRRTGNTPATNSAAPAVAPGNVTYSTEPLDTRDTPARTLTNVPATAATQPAGSGFPSYEDMVLSNRVQLPELHLDIHVFADQPARRFVFVNNRKYREGEALDEGGTVETITPRGVVLNVRGHRFELAPE